MRTLRWIVVAAVVAAVAQPCAALPEDFSRRILFLAQNSGSEAVTAATARLVKTSYFGDLVAAWDAHRAALAATAVGAASPAWQRTLDVDLTKHVDPQERGLSVDVERICGPVQVKVPAGTVAAWVAACVQYAPGGDDRRRCTFAVEVASDRVSAIHDQFEVLGSLPPELTTDPRSAFDVTLKRLLDETADPDAKQAIEAVMLRPPYGTDRFVDAVVAAWDAFQSEDPGQDPMAHVWKNLTWDIWWSWVDRHEPAAEMAPSGSVFNVTVGVPRGPVDLVVAGKPCRGWVVSAQIAYVHPSPERRNQTVPFAILLDGLKVAKVTPDFTEATK